ncbi:MAG: metal-sulfur cluster assembly factor [Gemmatimonadetes bacterium]|nr:metal-sulfur cluster assembly factor [Gemmatimonadota bacterium]
MGEATTIEAHLLSCLHDVEDAEMPLDVVDLGLIYGVRYDAAERRVEVDMTFTAMGCPAMEFMIGDVRDRLLREPEVDAVDVSIVWDPPWDRRRLTERGTAALAAWGIV